jgi:hypothetical protein
MPNGYTVSNVTKRAIRDAWIEENLKDDGSRAGVAYLWIIIIKKCMQIFYSILSIYMLCKIVSRLSTDDEDLSMILKYQAERPIRKMAILPIETQERSL